MSENPVGPVTDAAFEQALIEDWLQRLCTAAHR
jgi:hypothetical protein